MHKIKTYILTGFLGAGKTTILNHLLQQVENQKNLIVENEYGKVNIDSGLVEKKYDAIYELTNGCICCTYDEGFFDLLNDIVQNKREAENLFIETTGVADVSPIISLFNREDVKKQFELVNTICVCDAETVEDYLAEIPEVEGQIAHADIIVINKIEHVHPEYLKKLQQVLLQLNPFTKVLHTTDGRLDWASIQEKEHKINIPHKHIHTHSSHQIQSLLYETNSPIDVMKLRFVLQTTLMLYYKQIIRIKGYFIGNDNKEYLLQTAGKSLNIQKANQPIISQTQLVFLVKDVEKKSIERIMNQVIINHKTINA
ncbi:MAG: CobW family GTP-binding protein [Thermaurantimonas sp.]